MSAPRAWLALALSAGFALWLCSDAAIAHAQQAGRSRSAASAHARGDKRSKPARKGERTRADRKHPAAPARSAAPEAALPKTQADAEVPAPQRDEAKPAPESDRTEKSSTGGSNDGTAPALRGGASKPADSELGAADVHKEGDTEVKTMEFSGLDIEGQLKTPQMLYFLNRLRAEFGRPRLPHRSFMPELQAGTQDEAMR